MIEPGQPCVTMTGSAFGGFERTWMKGMSNPSIVVMNWGKASSRASSVRSCWVPSRWRSPGVAEVSCSPDAVSYSPMQQPIALWYGKSGRRGACSREQNFDDQPTINPVGFLHDCNAMPPTIGCPATRNKVPLSRVRPDRHRRKPRDSARALPPYTHALPRVRLLDSNKTTSNGESTPLSIPAAELSRERTMRKNAACATKLQPR